MKDLHGKVAVVTGAASGIGLGLAHAFAAEGMRVVMSDIERPVLERAAAELAAAGAEVLAVPADTSLLSEVETLASATIEHFGDVHVVCNNAGVGSRGLLMADLPLRDFEWVLGVNLWGVIYGTKTFLPYLLRNGEGHIVNTASINALVPAIRMAPYNASKAAVLALSETLYYEMRSERTGVGVSVVCPSWVRTNLSAAVRNLPERLAYELTTEQAEQMATYKARRRQQLTDESLEPADIAQQAIDAIRTERFYVITHEDSFDRIDAYQSRIMARENPEAPGV